MNGFLPLNPVIGFRKNGQPIYQCMGGAPDDDEQRDNEQQQEEQRADDAGPTLTHSQSVNRLKDIRSELERLAKLPKLDAGDEAYFRELTQEFDIVDEHRRSLERRAQLARIRSAEQDVDESARQYRIVPGVPQARGGGYDRDSILEPDSVEDQRFADPWNLSEVRMLGRDPAAVGTELRSRALAAIERMPVADDAIRSAATSIIERFDTRDSRIARHCLVTSAPAYVRAWSKMACNRQHTLTTEEVRALNAAEEFRAMSLTDSAGGYLVPFQLDPTVIITSAGSRNDIRRAARTVVATGDVWNGVSAAAVQWSWDAEASEASDDAPAFAQPTIPVYKAVGFVPISIEALQDEQNVAQEIGTLLAQGREDLEAVALISGTGVGQPTGIVTALAGTASEVAPLTPEVFALGDVYALQGSLAARYRGNASWLANNLIYNRIRQFDTAGGAGLWGTVGEDRRPELLGRPVLEAEAMDGTWDAAVAADNPIAVFGDFRNYVIADRIGMTVEFIPHLFHTANNRPSGQRGWYAYYRVGADSVNDGAFRMLNVETAV